MSGTENEMLQALVELEAAVKAIGTASPKPDLQPLFKRIDELAVRLPLETSPDLLHYLQRKSYEKARTWLEGRHEDISSGKCGR